MTLPEARTWPERCSGCGYHKPTQGCACDGSLKFTPGVVEGEARRDQAFANLDASDAAGENAVIFRAIREVAAQGREFSANDVRPLLPEGINRHRIGRQFSRAIELGVIEPCGLVKSDDPGTNAHRVLKYRRAA